MAYSFQYAPIPTPMQKRIPFLTFGDMDSFISSTKTVGMWSDGCLTNNGIYNCTQVCADSQLLYRQPYQNVTMDGYNTTTATNATGMHADLNVPYNIYNCMVYPYISALLTNEKVPDTYRKDAQTLADTMHIVPNISSTLLRKIRYTQWDCVDTFCAHTSSDARCTFTKTFTDSQSGPGFSQDQSLSFPKWTLISEQSSMNVYTDVAGIGVSIAFAIEASIITACWLFLWIFRYRRNLTDVQNVRFRQAHYNALEKLQHKSSPSIIRRLSARLSRRLFSNTHKRTAPMANGASVTDTIFSAIGSFQSAQCFFLLSMNIAFLGGLTYKGPFMASQSLGQFWNNVQYTQAITQASVAAVCLTQYCLRALGQNSVYYVFLTSITSALSIATFGLAWQYAVRANTSRIDLQIADPYYDQWQLKCGMVSPQTYNGTLNTYANPYRFGVCIIALSLALIAGFLVEFCCRTWILVQMTTTRWCKWFYCTFCAAFEICIWIWIITFFKFFWYPIVTVVPKSWALGQILSVLIWVPGLMEFVHAALQLARPYLKEVFHRSVDHIKDKTVHNFKSLSDLEMSGMVAEEMRPLSQPEVMAGQNKNFAMSKRTMDYAVVPKNFVRTNTASYTPVYNRYS